MKEIKLTQGKVALVDNEDFEELNKYKWACAKYPKTFYAVMFSWENGKQKTIYMHRQILKVNDRSIFVDHKDHDGLNNQRVNIRKCSHSENQRNKESVVGSSSKYIGVCWHKKDKKWQSAITINKKQKYLGQFDCPIKAAKVRDEEAKKVFGEFANLNFK